MWVCMCLRERKDKGAGVRRTAHCMEGRDGWIGRVDMASDALPAEAYDYVHPIVRPSVRPSNQLSTTSTQLSLHQINLRHPHLVEKSVDTHTHILHTTQLKTKCLFHPIPPTLRQPHRAARFSRVLPSSNVWRCSTTDVEGCCDLLRVRPACLSCVGLWWWLRSFNVLGLYVWFRRVEDHARTQHTQHTTPSKSKPPQSNPHTHPKAMHTQHATPIQNPINHLRTSIPKQHTQHTQPSLNACTSTYLHLPQDAAGLPH